MRHAVLALAVMVGLAGVARADDGADIRAVIADQLSAFGERDMDRAFAHASPSIQGIFQNPDRFRQMVESGYPMVWAPARTDVGPLTDVNGRTVQTMIFTDRQGRVHEAEYEMIQVDGVWRINGVRVRQLPGLGS